MPRYKIKDNQTGKTVIVSGDSSPTPQEAEEIFEEAGLRSIAEKSVDQEEPFLSPSTVLSTVGDVAGEIVGTPLAPATGGIINPITASAGLAGAGEFAGELLEGSSLKEAGKEAGVATGVAAATPAALKLAGKAAKPVFKVTGEFVQNVVGRNLTKMGNRVLARIGGEALDRGINIFDEAGERGLAALDRSEALKVINKSFDSAEKMIKKGIKKAGNPILTTKDDLVKLFDDAAEQMLEEADEKSILRLKERVLNKYSGAISAKELLALKRELFKKVASSKSAANKMKYKIAGQLNDILKEGVGAAKEGLREEEILYFMRDVFKRLRNQEFVKGPTLNPFFLGESAMRSVGPRRFAQLGEAAEVAGKAIENIPEKVTPAVEAISRFTRQPIRSLFTR